MTYSEDSYEQSKKDLKKIYERKTEFNKHLETMCETRMKSAVDDSLPQAKSHWALATMTAYQFTGVFEHFQLLSTSLFQILEQFGKRISDLEKTTQEMGGKINLDAIQSVSKFAEDFDKQVQESKKKLEEYKKKMKENDLAA